MPAIPANYEIEAPDIYTIDGLIPGLKYIFTLKTGNPTEGSAFIYFNNGPSGGFEPSDAHEMLGATGITERRLLCPGTKMQIQLDSGFTGPVKVTLIPEVTR